MESSEERGHAPGHLFSIGALRLSSLGAFEDEGGRRAPRRGGRFAADRVQHLAIHEVGVQAEDDRSTWPAWSVEHRIGEFMAPPFPLTPLRSRAGGPTVQMHRAPGFDRDPYGEIDCLNQVLRFDSLQNGFETPRRSAPDRPADPSPGHREIRRIKAMPKTRGACAIVPLQHLLQASAGTPTKFRERFHWIVRRPGRARAGK
jgi:hypothetical protein